MVVHRSFLRDEGDEADTLGLEFESYLTLGSLEMKNIAYFEVGTGIRVPSPGSRSAIPTQEPSARTASTICSRLSGSREGPPSRKAPFHSRSGAQFPTATDDTLGGGKWAAGPSFDYEYENGRLFAGAIALQLWSYAGDAERKDVNMLMIKPFVVFSLAENWDLLYMPYGVSVYWNKPRARKCYLPLGGGINGTSCSARCR